ncbi:MAG TPA: 3-dehydroquinate synthase [Candidatus Acidoferrum sp.]|nr:3-dehydroquinate synthase [Candidatus Acidoferrum sp.]
MKRILVRSSAGSYAVVCGTGALAGLRREIARAGAFSSMHVLTSPKVWNAVGQRVLRGLRGCAARVHRFDDSEVAKNLRSVETIGRSLVRAGADRRAIVVAVGGGVVGDVAGFAAASFLRGVALVQVPTTLVAQTDSAIGGKTGVNLPEGKNLVGAFYPPKLVLVDMDTLQTLPQREFRGGLAEVIKYGVIADARLFAFLEKNFERVLEREARSLEYLIARSAEIKARVVSKDERESGLREILNFGHTFGHALESATAYRRYQHGEAVAWGMMAAALYGHETGVTPAGDAARIISLVRRMGKLPAWPRIAAKRLIALMGSDKKARAGKLRFVLTPGIGKAATYEARDPAKLDLVLRMTPRVAEAGPVSHE